jgi:hypothetical protein
LLQQVDSEYEWHSESIRKFKNVILFETFDELKQTLMAADLDTFLEKEPITQFEENNFIQRMNSI